jgi:hypothetical protein
VAKSAALMMEPTDMLAMKAAEPDPGRFDAQLDHRRAKRPM